MAESGSPSAAALAKRPMRKFQTPFKDAPRTSNSSCLPRLSSHPGVQPRASYPSPAGAGLSQQQAAVGAGAQDGGWGGWTVQWRNAQTRKHKTWESDGYYTWAGQVGTLRDENAKVIATGHFAVPPALGDEFKISNKEVLIDDLLPWDEAADKFGLTGVKPNDILPPAPQPTAIVPDPPSSSALQTPTRAGSKKPIDKSTIVMPTPDVPLSAQAAGPRAKREELARADAMAPPAAKRARQDDAQGGDEFDAMLIDDDALDERQLALASQAAAAAAVRAQPPARPAFAGLRPNPAALKQRVREEEVQTRCYYYTGVYMKKSTAKHKKWESDGVLVVEGRAFRLMTADGSKQLTQGRTSTDKPFKPDDEVALNSFEMLIEQVVDEKFYFSGEIFGNKFIPIAAVPSKANAPFDPAASSYLAARTTPRTAPSAAPPARKSFKPLAPKDQPTEDTLAKLSAPVSSKNFFSATPSAARPTQAQHGGVVRQAVHPIKESSVLMPRPNEAAIKLLRMQDQPIIDVIIDPILRCKLRDHQIDGIKFMYEAVMGMRCQGQGCILADDMGLGKTLQAITLIYTLLKQSPFNAPRTAIQRAVIVCPVTLLQNWRAEFVKWLGRDRCNFYVAETDLQVQQWTLNRSAQVLIIGYERLQASYKHLTSAASGAPVGLIICDEGHKLKGKQTKINQALTSFTKCAKRVILSGTPVQNNLAEFHTMVDWIIPGILDDYRAFKTVYEDPIVRGRQPNALERVKKQGQARNETLNQITDQFVLRRTADIIAHFLPPKLEYTITVIPTKREVDLHKAILHSPEVRRFLNGDGGASVQQLSLLTLLRKLCNSPGLLIRTLREGKAKEILTPKLMALFDPNTREDDFELSGKLSVLGAMLKRMNSMRRNANRAQAAAATDANVSQSSNTASDGADKGTLGREKIVVVSNFTSTLDLIEKYCAQRSYTYCRLDGQTPQQLRQPMVNNFNKDTPDTPWVFLLSSKSGGTGLNIIGASRLVLVDSDWNPSNDLQAMARIHRDGQKKQCVIYRLLTAGTMDEKIFQRQVTKLGLTGSVMERSDSGGAGAGGADSFTMEELRKVFDLKPNTACETHDLLECKCCLGQPQIGHAQPDGGRSDDSSSDDGDGNDDGSHRDRHPKKPHAAFAPASQMAESGPAQDTRQLTSVLSGWTHHDCSYMPSVSEIEDQLLRDVIGFRASFNKTRAGYLPAHHPEMAEREGAAGDREGAMWLDGGMVGFAFARKSV